jgi:hypothetical protein
MENVIRLQRDAHTRPHAAYLGFSAVNPKFHNRSYSQTVRHATEEEYSFLYYYWFSYAHMNPFIIVLYKFYSCHIIP